MTTYQSNAKSINKSSTEVFLQLSSLKNIENFQEKIAESSSVKNLTISDNEISFDVDMAGTISLHIIETEPEKFVRYQLKSMLKDADLQINIKETSLAESEIALSLTADLPMMIKMMLGNRLNEGIDKIAEAIAKALND
ncbi:MAG: hypothetical protein FWF72_02290 [Paludibacter sp.]|nr:hypothetical protein [Paludibacter sp.]